MKVHTMYSRKLQAPLVVLLSMIGYVFCGPAVYAASCTTQSQMQAAQRDTLAHAAKGMLSEIQAGNVQALQADTIPAVAADFSGIASSIQNLKPLIQNAALTVDNVYFLDASTQAGSAASAPTEFFCGQPIVTINFSDLPAGTYALAIGHATGVAQPQQISLILAKAQDKWMLGGLFIKPMVFEGHDGLWYWTSARKYAEQSGNWAAWFYYRIADNLLSPLDILSSPNLEKLQHESEKIKPQNLPAKAPVPLTARGSNYSLTAVDTTTTFGALDLDVHYAPDPTQTTQLHDPPAARKQVMDIMVALLQQHPELHQAFHGMWVHADQGNVSLFALELPMEGITGATGASQPAAR